MASGKWLTHEKFNKMLLEAISQNISVSKITILHSLVFNILSFKNVWNVAHNIIPSFESPEWIE